MSASAMPRKMTDCFSKLQLIFFYLIRVYPASYPSFLIQIYPGDPKNLTKHRSILSGLLNAVLVNDTPNLYYNSRPD